MLVKGGQQAGGGWKIGVQDPKRPEREIFFIHSRGEKIGIATSGVFKRKGRAGDFSWHHIIDPRSGLPAENEILTVTAVAASAKQADILAKTVLILGQGAGLGFINGQPDAAAIIFLKNGQAIFSQRALPYLS